MGGRWSWFRHRATRRELGVRLPRESDEIFQLPQSFCTEAVALESTQPITEMINKEFPCDRQLELTTLRPSSAECNSTHASPTLILISSLHDLLRESCIFYSPWRSCWFTVINLRRRKIKVDYIRAWGRCMLFLKKYHKEINKMNTSCKTTSGEQQRGQK